MALSPARGAVVKARRHPLVRNRAHIWTKEELDHISELSKRPRFEDGPTFTDSIPPVPTLRRCKPRLRPIRGADVGRDGSPLPAGIPAVIPAGKFLRRRRGSSMTGLSAFGSAARIEICTDGDEEDGDANHSSVSESDWIRHSTPQTPVSESPSPSVRTPSIQTPSPVPPAIGPPAAVLPSSLFSTPTVPSQGQVLGIANGLINLTL